MNKKHIILSTLLLFLCIGSFSPFGCNTTITVTVTDSTSGIGIQGATVSIDAEGISSTTTGTDGTYTIPDVPYGPYTITVSSTGFENNTSDPAYSS